MNTSNNCVRLEILDPRVREDDGGWNQGRVTLGFAALNPTYVAHGEMEKPEYAGRIINLPAQRHRG